MDSTAAIHSELDAKTCAGQATASLLAELSGEQNAIAALGEHLAAERDRRSRLESELSCLQTENANLRSESHQVRADLARIESSLGQRVLRRLRRMPGFPLLRSTLQSALAVRAKSSSAVSAPVPLPVAAPSVPAAAPRPWQFVHANQAIPVVSICHPRWQGVRSAAEGHTPNLLITPEIAPSEIDAIAERLVRSGATHFISEGFFAGYAELLARLRQRMPAARIFSVVHGSFFQMVDNAELPGILRQLDAMRREGILDRVGFCKPGMAQALQRLGFPAFEVMNRVPGRATPPSRSWRSPARVFIPVGGQSRKNPHTQRIAALLAEGIGEVHVATRLDLQYLPAAAMEKVRVKVHETLDRARTRQLMEQSDLVLYVTISECAPMVPLESLAVGVPCLTGNNHRLFDDFPELVRLLVVSREDDAWAIAEAISRVQREYKLCCDLIRQFNEGYDRKAVKSVADFLELEVDAYNPPAAVSRAA